MVERLGDGPIEEQYRNRMRELAYYLDELFNGDAKGDEREVAFVLLVAPFGPAEGRCNYISNARREDVVTLMKEQIARFEADIATYPYGG